MKHTPPLPQKKYPSYFRHLRSSKSTVFPPVQDLEKSIKHYTRWGRFKRCWWRITGRIKVGCAYDPGVVMQGPVMFEGKAYDLHYEYDTKTCRFLITERNERKR